MKKKFNLQLFAEAATAGDGNGGETGVGTEAKANEAENNLNAGNNPEVNNNEEDSFEKLIEGKYKAEFENAVNLKLSEKENSITELTQKLERQNTVFDALSAKYGKSIDDIEGILKAVSSDESYFEEAAAREGITVEQYKNLRAFEQMQKRNAEFERAEQARTQAEKDIRAWFKECETLKEKYPGLDFQKEISNKDFIGLLKNGINFETAYKVIHADDIVAEAVTNAEKNAVIKMQNKASRPLENGLNSSTGAVISTGTKLTKQERADLARRAQRGEKIIL